MLDAASMNPQALEEHIQKYKAATTKLFGVNLPEKTSAHPFFKKVFLEAKEGDTILTLKELTTVRLIKNNFYDQIIIAKQNHTTIGQLQELPGKGRAKKGMFDGDVM